MTKTISASEFAAACLALLDGAAEKQEELLIEKDGRLIARVIPIAQMPGRSLESLRGSAKILGDIVSPIDDVEWNALK